MLKLLRFHCCALLTALMLPAVAGAAPDRLAAAVTRQIQVNQDRYGLAGQAVLIAHNGKVLFRGVDGLADLSTGRPVRAGDVFPVYSLAKLFLSALVMQLVERGEVDLDKPASAYVRGLAPAWQAITVRQALSVQLIDHALKPASDGAASAQAQSILKNFGLQGEAQERAINGTGYGVRENLGVAAAIRVFELNTMLFPTSANAWDSLAEAYQAQGDRDKANQLYEKARMLVAPASASGT